MKDAARHMIEIARAGSALYPQAEVAETVAFLEWLLDLNFVFLGYREYELVDLPQGRALAAVPGSGLGILSKVDWSAYERPVPLDDDRAQPAGADRGRRPADLLEDEPTLDGAPACADGLHRRAQGLDRWSHRRRGADGGPVHLQGLHGARRARRRCCTASSNRSSRPRICSRGRTTTRRSCRSSRASPRTSCSRPPRRSSGHRSWGCCSSRSPSTSACSSDVTSTDGASRCWSPSRGNASTRRCDSGCRSCSSNGSTARRSTTTSRSPRATSRSCTSPSTSGKARSPTSRSTGSSGTSWRSPARGTTGSSIDSSRSTGRGAPGSSSSAGRTASPTTTRRRPTSRSRASTSSGSTSSSRGRRPS